MSFPWKVTEEFAGQRLDQVLAQQFADLSRSQWTKRIDDARVLVDGKATAASFKVKEGMEVSLVEAPAKEAFDMTFTGTAPEVLFEDADMIVINKPVGLTVHAGAGVGTDKTLVGWLLASGKIKLGAGHGLDEERPGIVHRLDRGTSGVMVVAKTAKAHTALAEQFEHRTARRLYWAVIEGRIRELFQKRNVRLEKLLHRENPTCALRLVEDGICSFASQLARDTGDRTRFRVAHEGGKHALTHFVEIGHTDQWSLLELKLGTGRTHQIRVHLSFLGFPILGDGHYGGRGHERILLHAHSLRLTHPKTGKEMQFEAPWPASTQAWLTAEGLKPESRESLWQKLPADSNSDSNKDGLED